MEEKQKFSHWSERLAYEVISKKEEPYVISSGMTTSGPTHIGTVCEFLFPYAIKKKMEEKGKKVKFYFVADILDAFDSIPKELEDKKEFLEEHLGKPLCEVPFPGEEVSYGEHYLNEAKAIMDKIIGLENIEIIKANDLYESGSFDYYAKLFLEKEDKVREVVEKSSGRQLSKKWNVLMPICEKCGKIATTIVLSLDKENWEYEYSCENDVGYTKGCGFKGKAKIEEHRYKLQWRLHWAAWQHFFKTSIEGGGVDHFTKGGSRDTLVMAFREIYGLEEPIGYKYGFILIGGKKYSKSKGRGMPVREMIKLIPPKALAYHLLKFDLEENIDFVPEKENILNLINDYEYASTLKNKEELTKAERKKLSAYLILEGKDWEGNFRDYLMYYQIYKDWEKVKMHLGKDVVGVERYIEEWIAKDFVPEDYDFSYSPKKAEGIVKEFLCSLENSMDALEIHNKVYEFSKEKGISPKELFSGCYKTLIGKERGPRLGKLIYALGVEKVKEDVC